MTATPTAGWKLTSLMTSLTRSGWGELAGRDMQGVRSTLAAVVARVNHGSGIGRSTAWEVSQAAGLSLRWTRRCLHLLEDLGVLVWHRGGVIEGKPQHSVFKIVKARIVDLIMAARPAKDEADAEHSRVTRERVRGLRWQYSKARKPRSVHAALSGSSPSPSGGYVGGPPTEVRATTPKGRPAGASLPAATPRAEVYEPDPASAARAERGAAAVRAMLRRPMGRR